VLFSQWREAGGGFPANPLVQAIHAQQNLFVREET